MSSRLPLLGFVVAISIASAFGAVAPASAVDWARVAKIGDAAPGGQVGETFVEFSDPSVLADGTIYFLAATQATNAIFRRSAEGVITRVFPNAIGSPVPGSDPQVLQLAIVFDDHLDYEVAEGDVLRVISSVELVGCATATTVLLARDGPAAPLALAVQAGELVPALGAGWRLRGRLGTTVFDGVPKRNAQGRLGFVSQASNDTPCPSAPAPPSAWAAFTSDALGALVVAAQQGQSAPGFPSGVFDGAFHVDVNASNQLLVSSRVEFASPASSLYAFYRWSSGLGLERLVWQGRPAPGGGLFESAIPAHFAPDGAFFFVEDRPVAPGGLYEIDAANAVQALHQLGEAAPELPESTFARFSSAKFLASDDYAFTAAVYTQEGLREGIWSANGTSALALRYAGTETAEIGLPRVALVTLADSDRLVYATRTNALANGFAYFASEASGDTTPLAAPGDAFDFAPGDVRVAAQVELATDAAARRSVAVVTDVDGAQALFAPDAEATPGLFVAAGALVALRTRRLSPRRGPSPFSSRAG